MTSKAMLVIAMTSALAVAQTAPPAQPAKPAAAPAPAGAKPAPATNPAKPAAAPAGATAPAATAAKPAPAAAAKPAAAKPAATNPVDSVIELVQSKMSDSLIISTLRRQNKPVNLSTADLVKLQKAGVSENVIAVMMDPSAGAAPAQAAAPEPAPAPVAAAPAAPAPAPEPAPAPAAAPAPATTAAAAAPTQAEKKRVIVDEFDYSAVKTQVQAVFNTQANIGKGIRAMLVKRIATDNKVVVVERAKMDTLMKEQDFAAGNRAKQGTGARIGRISGANALLAGDIVVFGRDDRKTKVKGGGIIGAGFGAIAAMKNEDKAVIVIDYRLIDAETTEVIDSGEARGESVRKSKGFGAMAGAFGKAAGGMEIDMTSSNFAETIIGEATMDAVNKLAAILNEKAANMKQAPREVEALVADVNGGVLTLSAGSNDGVNVGETFEIFKVVREVRDPVTKEVLDRITEKTGEMKISNVRDRVASGTYVGSPAQAGFVARKKVQ